jgi:hypothetical protein
MRDFHSSVALFRCYRQTPGLIFRNNLVKEIFVCNGHRDLPFAQLSRSVEKTCTRLFLSQILFQNPKNYSLGVVRRFCYHSLCYSRSLLTKSAAATAMFTSFRVDFGRPPLSSTTNSLPSRNREYNLKTFDRFRASFSSAITPILMFMSQIDRFESKFYGNCVYFRHPWHTKKTDFTRQVITRTLSKINKRNSVCERMLVDITYWVGR